MRVLVLSNTPWSNDNSFGNTFSNLFEGINDIEIANIYCRYGVPQNAIVSRYYQITEKSLIKNLKDKKIPSGQEINIVTKSVDLKENEQKIFNTARTHRLQIFFWIRDFIWKIGRWKSRELKQFIDEFSPELIYLPLYYSNYLLDIGDFLVEYTGCKVIGHVSDDIYSLRQFSISPLFWIDRFIKRKKLKK